MEYDYSQTEKAQVAKLRADLVAAEQREQELLGLLREIDTDYDQEGHPVRYGEYDGDGAYVAPTVFPNIPAIEKDLAHYRAWNVRLGKDLEVARDYLEMATKRAEKAEGELRKERPKK